jgi:2OG-Fe(II) oxygenase superfamily
MFFETSSLHLDPRSAASRVMTENPLASSPAEPAEPGVASGAAQVCIRGRTLDLDDLFRPAHFDAATLAKLGAKTRGAAPFAHLDVEGWFNPVLLELVFEEFDLFSSKDIRPNKSRYEATHRLSEGAHLGPATTLYFGIVNSGLFVALLSQLTGIANLLPDPTLHGGGLHETRNGGKFGIHRDFDRHPRTGLENRLVFITYLNKTWRPEWHGALELWDAESKACVKKVEPELGRSILMCNGHRNFHGHPTPLNMPTGASRRSIASYYYTNTQGRLEPDTGIGSVFMSLDALDRLKDAARGFVPPLIWNWVKKRFNGG